MEKITLAQSRDLGQTIGDPFLFARANLKPLFKGYLYYSVPPLLVAAALTAFGFKDLTSGLSSGMGGRYPGLAQLGTTIIIAYLIFIVTSVFQQVFVTEYMLLKETTDDVDVPAVIRRLKEDWVIIVLTYLFLIPLSIFGGVIVGVIFRLNDVIGEWGAGLLIFILYLFIIYSMIPLSNLMFIRLRERLGLFTSLTKCFRITAGYWWRTFTAWFVSFMIFYAMMISAMLPFVFIVAVIGLLSAKGAGAAGTATTAILGVSITLGSFLLFFVMNLANVFIGINYFSLSERYDNYHLKTEIEQIGKNYSQNTNQQEGEY